MLLDTLAMAFWPTVAGLVLAGWLGRANPNVLVATWVPAPLLAVAGMVHTSIHDIATPVVLLDIFIGMLLFGALCLWAVYRCGSRLTTVRRLGLGLFGLAMIGYGGQMLIGDYAMERQVVEGEVRLLRVQENQDMPSEYHAMIGNGTFKVTTRLYAVLRVGDHVRATVGRGSGYVYAVERM
jgi:hypothetical protein